MPFQPTFNEPQGAHTVRIRQSHPPELVRRQTRFQSPARAHPPARGARAYSPALRHALKKDSSALKKRFFATRLEESTRRGYA